MLAGMQRVTFVLMSNFDERISIPNQLYLNTYSTSYKTDYIYELHRVKFSEQALKFTTNHFIQ